MAIENKEENHFYSNQSFKHLIALMQVQLQEKLSKQTKTDKIIIFHFLRTSNCRKNVPTNKMEKQYVEHKTLAS